MALIRRFLDEGAAIAEQPGGWVRLEHPDGRALVVAGPVWREATGDGRAHRRCA